VSCGNPHAVPCDEVLDRVYEFLDGEIDGKRRHEIKEHLEECSPCLQKFGLEETVKAIVKRSCSDPAPSCAATAEKPRRRARRQLLGRLPWLALLFLRAFFLRDFFAMTDILARAHPPDRTDRTDRTERRRARARHVDPRTA
jgi:mycothiol system anti-sigma-R factor